MATDRRLISILRDRALKRKTVYSRRINSGDFSQAEELQLLKRYNGVCDASEILAKHLLIDILNNDLFEIYVCNAEPIHNGVGE